MAMQNLWVRDAGGVWRKVKEVYMMSETGSWSASFPKAYLQTYQYSPTHPSIVWRKVLDTGTTESPPTVAPGSLTLVNAPGLQTKATWTNGSSAWLCSLIYNVVDSSGNPVEYGWDRIVSVPANTSDTQTWESTILNNGWRIKVTATFVNDAGSGPAAGPTPAVTLRP